MFIVPTPVDVTITHANVVTAGSSIFVTCTIELSPEVDIPVTVTTAWTGPARTILTQAHPGPVMMENFTRYTSTAMVDVARTGSYTCQVTINSSSHFITGSEMLSRTAMITVCKC